MTVHKHLVCLAGQAVDHCAIPEFVLFHVPHDSTWVPAEVRSQLLLDDVALAAEIVKMTDHLTSHLYTADVPLNQVVRAEVSRLVVDVERFNDLSEVMLDRGMGVLYERTADGSKLRDPLTPEQREHLIAKWYMPHHQRLATLANDMLNLHGRALLIDCHSFPARPLPYESDQRQDRPEICIGTDTYHTPKVLEHAFINAFVDVGFNVRKNSPFGGALVPMQQHRTDPRLSAIMVEVNRSLYLDETTGLANSNFDAVGCKIRSSIRKAIQDWSQSSMAE